MTGQELGRELRQIWQNSRPNSPAPSARNSMDWGSGRGPLASPTGGSKSHLSRVEALNSPRPESPIGGARNEDFATGYSLGLIGGVRTWVSSFFFFSISRTTRKLIIPDDAKPPIPPGAVEPSAVSHRRRRVRADQRLRRGSPRASRQGRVDSVDKIGFRHLHFPLSNHLHSVHVLYFSVSGF